MANPTQSPAILPFEVYFAGQRSIEQAYHGIPIVLASVDGGELVIMRNSDLEMGERTWIYQPSTHKTEHHGIDRRILLGQRAQDIVRPFLRADGSSYLFRPIDAIRTFHETRRELAGSTSSTKSRRKRNPSKRPGEHYTTASYCYAIHMACKKAGISCWGPNRLRHNTATMLRKKYGIEAARVVLGHTSAAMTEVYAELDRRKAADIMAEVG